MSLKQRKWLAKKTGDPTQWFADQNILQRIYTENHASSVNYRVRNFVSSPLSRLGMKHWYLCQDQLKCIVAIKKYVTTIWSHSRRNLPTSVKSLAIHLECNVVLGLASSEDLSEVWRCVSVSWYLVVWVSNRLTFVNIAGHENLVPQTCLGGVYIITLLSLSSMAPYMFSCV